MIEAFLKQIIAVRGRAFSRRDDSILAMAGVTQPAAYSRGTLVRRSIHYDSCLS